jgi:hypothetical protein
MQFSMKSIRWLLPVYALIAAACSSSATGPIPLSALNGQWATEDAEVPGLSYQFTLALADTQILGSGQWVLPDGQTGAVSVAGATIGDSVSIDFTLAQEHEPTGGFPFLVEHFDGRLKSSVDLSGTAIVDGVVKPQTYRKTGS